MHHRKTVAKHSTHSANSITKGIFQAASIGLSVALTVVALLALALAVALVSATGSDAATPQTITQTRITTTWAMGHFHVSADPTSRTFYLQRPTPAVTPLPLMIMLHGASHTAGVAQTQTQLSPWAQTNNVVLAYGEGIGGRWNAGPECCDAPKLPSAPSTRDDISYIQQIIDKARALTPIDPQRINVVGFSNGAMLAARAGCELPEVTGVGEVAGVLLSVPCPIDPLRTTPLKVWGRHGVNDTTVPVGGGAGFEGRIFPPWTNERVRFAPAPSTTYTASPWSGGHAWSATGKELAVDDLMWATLQ